MIHQIDGSIIYCETSRVFTTLEVCDIDKSAFLRHFQVFNKLTSPPFPGLFTKIFFTDKAKVKK